MEHQPFVDDFPRETNEVFHIYVSLPSGTIVFYIDPVGFAKDGAVSIVELAEVYGKALGGSKIRAWYCMTLYIIRYIYIYISVLQEYI